MLFGITIHTIGLLATFMCYQTWASASTPTPTPTSTPTPTPSSTPTPTTTATPTTAAQPSEPIVRPGDPTVTSNEQKKPERSDDPCKQKDGMDKQAMQQVGEYCAAAEAAEKAAKDQQMLGGVHAGVAGICLIPCAANGAFGSGMLLAQICSGSSIAAAVGDVVVTKQFTGAIGALVGGYGLIRSFNSGGAAAAKETAKMSAEGTRQASSQGSKAAKSTNMDMTSCITAATETLMSAVNFMGAEDSKKTAKDNRDQAKQLVDDTLSIVPKDTPPGGIQGPSISGGTIALGPSTTTPTAYAATSAGDLPSGSAVVSHSGSGKCDGFANSMNCAVAQGNKFPAIARSGDFISTLEKFSGLPIDKLMAKNNTAGIINAVAGKAIGDKGQSAVSAAVAKAEEQLRAPGTAGATYSGGGGGGGDAPSHDPMAGLGDALASLADGGNKKEDDADNGARSEEFGAQTAFSSITGTEQDRSMSIFTRVSRRYAASRDRLMSLRYASPQNRALSR